MSDRGTGLAIIVDIRSLCIILIFRFLGVLNAYFWFRYLVKARQRAPNLAFGYVLRVVVTKWAENYNLVVGNERSEFLRQDYSLRSIWLQPLGVRNQTRATLTECDCV